MWRLPLVGFVGAVILAAAVSNTVAQDNGHGELTPIDIFNQRIMPIFKSPQPSSCVQCHLAAVDLKDYILPSHEKTFASLRAQGLINLEQPGESKILTLIQMGEKDLDQGARLIHEKTRRAEYEAFANWIELCCNDPQLRALPPPSDTQRARPPKPDPVIRHARKSRVLDSFVRNVWSQRMRCFPCHTPFELDESNPRHEKPIQTQKEFKLQYGEELAGRMDIFKETPAATMQYLIEKSRETPSGELPLINLADPRTSLLVMKPTSKLPKKNAEGKFVQPAPGEPLSHMGGLKMHRDDQSYKSFIAWIQDYARVVGDRYASVGELPADNWYASKRVLRLASAPTAWPVGTPVQLFVHEWNESNDSWEPEPIAFTQGTVTPRRMVNGALFLLASTDSKKSTTWDPENATLPRGRYLIKVYVDSQQRLEEDASVLLGEEDYQGQAEIKKARWREGFRHAETISGKLLSSP